jgi:uncharacterized protein (DUF433 family)
MKISRIVSDPGIMGGTPVFEGTRVPVSIIIEEMSKGKFDSEHYKKHYPSLTPEHLQLAIRLTIAVGRWPKDVKQPRHSENKQQPIERKNVKVHRAGRRSETNVSKG